MILKNPIDGVLESSRVIDRPAERLASRCKTPDETAFEKENKI